MIVTGRWATLCPCPPRVEEECSAAPCCSGGCGGRRPISSGRMCYELLRGQRLIWGWLQQLHHLSTSPAADVTATQDVSRVLLCMALQPLVFV